MESSPAAKHGDREGRSGAGAVVVLLLFLCLLPVLYFLSVGPAIWYVNHYPGDHPVLTLIYYPIEWLYENLGPLRGPIEWYCELWR